MPNYAERPECLPRSGLVQIPFRPRTGCWTEGRYRQLSSGTDRRLRDFRVVRHPGATVRQKVVQLLILEADHLFRFLDGHPVISLVACTQAFKIRGTESIVFQLRVVVGAPKSSSIWPRHPILRMWRRYSNRRRCLDPTRTNHSSPPGNAIGREALPRPAFDRMLTNRTASGRDGHLQTDSPFPIG